MTFDGLKRGHYGVILADPPWRFRTWDQREAIPRTRTNGTNVLAATHYGTMPIEELQTLPIGDLATSDCSLFLWCCWPNLLDALSVVDAWGFEFKTAAFVWTKAHAGQLELFQDDIETLMGMGYWTRANSEPCLLATRGRPKRINADVRQAIIAPRREHSRKPDGIHERIERLVAGPYLELFARQRRPGWDCWGDEVDKFAPQPLPDDYDATDDFAKSYSECLRAIRQRKANGGKGWGGWE
jgi:N6-adenosine-specific RNA methylase IME4